MEERGERGVEIGEWRARTPGDVGGGGIFTVRTFEPSHDFKFYE